MNLFMAIINAVTGFIRRNPLTCLVILILAVAAPAVLKGIAVFILYFLLGLLLLAALLTARPFLTPCPLGCRPSFATDSGLIHPWQSYLSLSQHLCCCQP